MATDSLAARYLAREARALLTRVTRLRPFALHMPMVPAALSPAALAAIEHQVTHGRRTLVEMVHSYLLWLTGPAGRRAAPAEAQRRYTLLRLTFNALLSQFDIFADVLTQRSEHGTGVWLAGLDAVAADALTLPGRFYRAPPLICYLDRGPGAAIRRARTRLPGGARNPVAIVRVPRERMVGSGIASSLVHEVGHQGAALLDLVNSLKPVMQGMPRSTAEERLAWTCWERWISEILADFWSVAKVGVAATLGLMGVVSLPRAFVFRVNLDDPHPIPWFRVKLSCAMGNALHPHPQWGRLARLWESLYPTAGLDRRKRMLLAMLQATTPRFIALLLNHRPQSLRGNSLIDALSTPERRPAALAARFRSWQNSPAQIRAAGPSLVFAVIGQAKADGLIKPEQEGEILAHLLPHWAQRNTLNVSPICATRPTALDSQLAQRIRGDLAAGPR